MYYLFMCKSLTYAQRSGRLLERKGIAAIVTKAPKTLSDAGCSYGIKVKQQNISEAMRILAEADLSPHRVFRLQGTDYIEVTA